MIVASNQFLNDFLIAVNCASFIALEVGIGDFEIRNGGTEDVVAADIGELAIADKVFAMSACEFEVEAIALSFLELEEFGHGAIAILSFGGEGEVAVTVFFDDCAEVVLVAPAESDLYALVEGIVEP